MEHCRDVWAILREIYVTHPADAAGIDWGRCELANERAFMAYWMSHVQPSLRALELTVADFGARHRAGARRPRHARPQRALRRRARVGDAAARRAPAHDRGRWSRAVDRGARAGPLRDRHLPRRRVAARRRARHHARAALALDAIPTAGQPAPDGARVAAVVVGELAAQRRLLDGEHEDVEGEGESGSVERDRGRAEGYRPAERDGEHADVHRVAHEAVRPLHDERLRRVDGRRRAAPDVREIEHRPGVDGDAGEEERRGKREPPDVPLELALRGGDPQRQQHRGCAGQEGGEEQVLHQQPERRERAVRPQSFEIERRRFTRACSSSRRPKCSLK